MGMREPLDGLFELLDQIRQTHLGFRQPLADGDGLLEFVDAWGQPLQFAPTLQTAQLGKV